VVNQLLVVFARSSVVLLDSAVPVMEQGAQMDRYPLAAPNSLVQTVAETLDAVPVLMQHHPAYTVEWSTDLVGQNAWDHMRRGNQI
jgi:hypothetical protein